MYGALRQVFSTSKFGGTGMLAKRCSPNLERRLVEQLKKLTHDARGHLISRLETGQLALAAAGLRAIGLPATPLARFAQDTLSRCARKLVNP